MSKPATAAVRCNSLTLDGQGNKTLKAQEKHGKRLDGTSQMRRVRDVDPLVYGGLDLRDLYDAHVEGATFNRSCKRPVLHFIIKMPEHVLMAGDDAPEPYREKSKEKRHALMLEQAVLFVNETHGGDAVFAARVDRDEAGELVVDVFAAPKFAKHTKNRGKPKTEIWCSPTKFGKDLAIKHQTEIQSRHDESKGLLTGPRHVGIALQSEFAEFFERENGMKLTRKAKDSFGDDRLEIEAYKAVRDAEDGLETERREMEAVRLELAARESKFEKERQKAANENAKIAAKAEAVGGAVIALVEEVEAQTIKRTPEGKITAKNPDKLRLGYPELAPAINAAADHVTRIEQEGGRMRGEARDIKEQRIELVQERQELLAEWSMVRDLKTKLTLALSRVSRWLKRPDLTDGARAEAVRITRHVDELLCPEDPVDDAGPAAP